MKEVKLRQKKGSDSPGDLRLTVQEKTFEYLMTAEATEVRVSAFLDEDCDEVHARYAELFVHDTCPYEYRVTRLLPGSRTRTGIALPGPMQAGEQLTVLVVREET